MQRIAAIVKIKSAVILEPVYSVSVVVFKNVLKSF